jgi:carboxymethylenebutenolidase
MRPLHAVGTFVAVLSSVGCAAAPGEPAATPDLAGAPTVRLPSRTAANPTHTGQAVPLANGGSGYLALPAPGPRHAAILVIQEWWGMNDWIKTNTDRFATQGYVSFAVDLYRGRSATSAEEAHELMRGLPEDRGLGDIKAAFDLLAARPDVDPARIGIVGWCMGGGYALDFATVEPRLRAAVVNYGHLFTDAAKIGAIHAALLGNFGATDRGIPAADVAAFEALLRSQGKDIDFKEYDGAGHAFMNPSNSQGYDASASADAWGRVDAFFAKQLGGGS